MFDSPTIELRRLTQVDRLAEKWIASDMANPGSSDFIADYYDHYPNFGTGWLGVVDKQSNKLVGRAGLLSRSDIFNPAELEIAYVVDAEHRRKGFAKASAGLLLDYAKQNVDIRRVFTGIAPDNIASQRIAASIGLQQEYDKPHFGLTYLYFWYRKPGACRPEKFIDQQR